MEVILLKLFFEWLYSKLFLLVSIVVILISFNFSFHVSASEDLNYEDEVELVEDVAKTLGLLFGDAEAYDSNGVLLGFKKEVLERELKDTSIYEEVISGLEVQNLLISESDSKIKKIGINLE